jgi:UDP-4-amino-4,6-dideoxy-N-acetyl-beta-L-altrosamine transaminase
MIPYGRQDIQQADIDAVTEVLTGPFLTQGPAVPAFEAAICNKTGAAHAVAVNSATSALHVAYMALGLGQGDLLWTSPNTFVATSNAALYCGADVDFVDIDPDTYNISVAKLQEKLVAAKASGRLPKIVSVVQFAGQSADMKAIAALAQTYGFAVVEDASHAIGGSYLGEPVGNCRYSDICVFSFHPVKIVTTAEGGAATTNDSELATRMQLFRSHGVTREARLLQSQSPEPWYYEQLELGYNYRMTDLQAALGVSQMNRLETYVDQRHALMERYDAALADLPIKLPVQFADQRSALHLYPVQVVNHDRRAVFDALRAGGLGVNVHYIPVHTQPYYRALGFNWGDFPEAETYYKRAISLPMFPVLTDAEFDVVVAQLRAVLCQH